MNSQSYFRFVSTVIILINLFVGIGALYLIERIVPAIDEILKENAYSVSSAVLMQESLNSSNNGNSQKKEQFWQAYEKAKSNITIKGEEELILEIKNLGEAYWNGSESSLNSLSQKVVLLAEMNLHEMNKKNTNARAIGLAGAWALGFLVLISLIIQLILRKRLFLSLIQPTTNLIAVINDFVSGNYQRRVPHDNDASNELKNASAQLNKLLDRNMIQK